jgi:hypothetical protein
MIKAIIYHININERPTRPTERTFNGVSNTVLENVLVQQLGNESRFGFHSLEDALAVREELARKNPGKLYGLAVFKDAVECPPGDIQYKQTNDRGELVNV